MPLIVAVTLAVPEATGVTLPVASSIVITFPSSSSVDHKISISSGLITASGAAASSPTLRARSVRETEATVTSQTAVCSPAAAVIVVVPSDNAVISPVASSTVATSVLEDVHVTVGSVAFSGKTVASSCAVLPFSTVRVSLLRIISETEFIFFPILIVTLLSVLS